MLDYIDRLKSFLSIRLIIGMNNTGAEASYNNNNPTVTYLKPTVCSSAGTGDFIPYLAKKIH